MPDHLIAELARRVEADPKLWDEAAAEVRDPSFLQVIVEQGTFPVSTDEYNSEAADIRTHLTVALMVETVEANGLLPEVLRRVGVGPAANLLHVRALAMNHLGHADAALQNFELAVALLEPVVADGDWELRNAFARIHLNRGTLLRDLQRPELAIDNFGVTIEIRRHAAVSGRLEARRGLANAYLERGNAHNLINHWDAALADYAEAAAIYRSLIYEGHPALENDLSGCLMNRGLVLLDTNRPQAALAELTAALEIRQRTIEAQPLPALASDLARAYDNRGNVYCRLGEYAQAVADHTTAADILRSLVGDHPHWKLEEALGFVYVNRGGAYLNGSDPAAAQVDFSLATEIFERLVAAGHRGLEDRLAATLHGTASAQSLQGEWRNAVDNWERAAELTDQLVDLAESERHRTAQMRKHHLIYDGVITAFCRLADEGGVPPPAASGRGATCAERAAYWSERGRARVLSVMMRAAGQAPFGVAESEFVGYEDDRRRLRDLEHRLLALESELARVDAAVPRRTALGSEIERLRTERAEAFRRVDQARTRFAVLDPQWFPGQAPMRADEIAPTARRLQAGLLTLWPTYWGTCVVLAAPDGVVHATLLNGFSVSDAHRLLFHHSTDGGVVGWMADYEAHRRNPTDRRLYAGWKRTMEKTLQVLGERLWQPLSAWLRGRLPPSGDPDAPTHLVALTTRGLSVLPLHAAFCEVEDGRAWADHEYRWSYAVSLRTLARGAGQRDRQSHVREGLLAVRNPTGHLPALSLRGAEFEVDAAARLFARRLVLGYAGDPHYPPATCERLREELPRWPTALFSTHAIFSARDPWAGSGIYTADSVLGRELPSLNLADLYKLDLSRLSLAVISACESGLTDYADLTEEQVGLPAALTVAGVASVIGSLWMVSDAATALLVTRFFTELFAERAPPPGLALWRAQRWLRSRTLDELTELLREVTEEIPQHAFNHPAYWAAFSCYGAD